jgi:hypothetical protein
LISRGPLYHLLQRANSQNPRGGVLQRGEQRLGQQGFRVQYSTVPELMNRVRELTALTAALEERLFLSISWNDVSRFERDIHDLMSRGIEQNSRIHVEVLTNLVGKLLSKRNHRFTELVRMISRLYKRRLGGAHYQELAALFGLESETAIWRDQKQVPRLRLEENSVFWDKAVAIYRDAQGRPLPIINCGDGVRVTMRVSAVVGSGNEVELVGECWSANRRTWAECTVRVPKPAEGEDEYHALAQYVKRVNAGR